MSQIEDLFALSYGTDQDVVFDRQDAFTAQRILEEIADLMTHLDNGHIQSVEVRRIGRLDDAVAPQLTPLSLKGSHASAGWGLECWTAAAYEPKKLAIQGYERMEKKLVSLLADRATERFSIAW